MRKLSILVVIVGVLLAATRTAAQEVRQPSAPAHVLQAGSAKLRIAYHPQLLTVAATISLSSAGSLVDDPLRAPHLRELASTLHGHVHGGKAQYIFAENLGIGDDPSNTPSFEVLAFHTRKQHYTVAEETDAGPKVLKTNFHRLAAPAGHSLYQLKANNGQVLFQVASHKPGASQTVRTTLDASVTPIVGVTFLNHYRPQNGAVLFLNGKSPLYAPNTPGPGITPAPVGTPTVTPTLPAGEDTTCTDLFDSGNEPAGLSLQQKMDQWISGTIRIPRSALDLPPRADVVPGSLGEPFTAPDTTLYPSFFEDKAVLLGTQTVGGRAYMVLGSADHYCRQFTVAVYLGDMGSDVPVPYIDPNGTWRLGTVDQTVQVLDSLPAYSLVVIDVPLGYGFVLSERAWWLDRSFPLVRQHHLANEAFDSLAGRVSGLHGNQAYTDLPVPPFVNRLPSTADSPDTYPYSDALTLNDLTGCVPSCAPAEWTPVPAATTAR